ncbi:4-hydroxyphenylpyruvate dioxygenase [Streptomyces sp. MUM 16J]|uniref:4-hydroxyphenylpyruvate dioxygenase n=1 Tax=Streptomyces sp. MUM 16J TaxID=2791988 RepID=UPI001F0379B6|nr:4-hydroxyphenylpyruvate dioxygenase [Streptomyces sp. MUM 16J]MCH0561193.1 4-hydroxyphenylpyruvate dioxygenase [Streptomyces sp. MUM 16J]
MTVRDIAYVELYTKDKISAVEYLISAMGFTRVADSVEVDRSSVLLRQNGVQLVVTSGWGTWRFLDQYGEGVADVAVACADVAATRAAAVRAGAAVTDSPQGNPVVTAVGGIHHTLVPASAGTAAGVPPGRSWTATPGAPSAPGGWLRRLDHVLIRLPAGTLADYAGFCGDAFGFDRTAIRRLDLGGRSVDSVVVRSRCGRAAFVLSAPVPAGADAGAQGDPSGLPREGKWPGVPGLAFLLDDVPSAAGSGLADRDAWVHHDARGPLVQSVVRSPLAGRAFCLQLVQRRGSETFGDAGIRALYKSPECDRVTVR